MEAMNAVGILVLVVVALAVGAIVFVAAGAILRAYWPVIGGGLAALILGGLCMKINDNLGIVVLIVLGVGAIIGQVVWMEEGDPWGHKDDWKRQR